MSIGRRGWPQVRWAASDYGVDSPPSPSHLPSHELLPHPRGRPHGRHRLPARHSVGSTRGDLHHERRTLRRGHDAEPALRRTPTARPPRRAAAAALVRTFVGLAVVVAVIYGLYWVLKQVKASREERAVGSGLETTATVPLGPNRSLHLVRAGNELVLVGVAEHAVTPIRTYTEEEARAAGLIPEEGDEDDDDVDPSDRQRSPPARRSRPAQDDHRRGARAHPPGHGARVMPRPRATAERRRDPPPASAASRCVPAALFTVTGFTRILIVLGFIRTGLGTPTAPPNQVLVGIALFLTIFVMMPTFKAVKEDADRAAAAPARSRRSRRSSAARSRSASSCSSRRATATSRCS